MTKEIVDPDCYKARSPQKTVERIMGILSDNSIIVEERGWREHSGMFASLGLVHTKVPMVMTCGKGRNQDYARASAYAEFMERLQNLALLDGKIPESNQSITRVKFPDTVRAPIADVLKKNRDILKFMLKEDCWEALSEIGNTEIDCLPFYDVFSKGISLVPRTILRLSVGSNGMCAGNTAEEALIQGFCEVYERHFLIKLFNGEIDNVPKIPESLLSESLQKAFTELRNYGFEVHAKDCSLDGSIPTYGILVVKGNKAAFSIGSAPHFGIALERCITELFQGMDFQLLEKVKMKPIATLETCFEKRNFTSNDKIERHNYLKTLRSGSGVVHPILFDNSVLCKKENLSCYTHHHSKETLCEIIKPIKKAGYKALVREVGFLGFPTFQVYVPGMSEMLEIDHERLLLYLKDLPRAQHSFRNVGNESIENIKHLALTLEKLIDNPFIEQEAIVQHLTTQCFKSDATLSKTEPEILLSLFWYKAGDISKALLVYESYIKKKIGTEAFHNPPEYAKYHIAFLSFLRNRENGCSMEDALEKVNGQYEKNIADEINLVFQNPEKLGELFGIPPCIKCIECQYEEVCYSKDIASLTNQLFEKIHKVEWNQEKLSELWENYEF